MICASLVPFVPLRPLVKETASAALWIRAPESEITEIINRDALQQMEVLIWMELFTDYAGLY